MMLFPGYHPLEIYFFWCWGAGEVIQIIHLILLLFWLLMIWLLLFMSLLLDLLFVVHFVYCFI